MPGVWEAIPGRQRKQPVRRAEAERKGSIWEMARTCMAGLGRVGEGVSIEAERQAGPRFPGFGF